MTHESPPGMETGTLESDFHRAIDNADDMVNELYDPNISMEIMEETTAHATTSSHAPPQPPQAPDLIFKQGFASFCSRNVQTVLWDFKQARKQEGYVDRTVNRWVTGLAKFEHWLDRTYPGLSLHPDPQSPRLREASEAYKGVVSDREFSAAFSHFTGYTSANSTRRRRHT